MDGNSLRLMFGDKAVTCSGRPIRTLWTSRQKSAYLGQVTVDGEQKFLGIIMV